MVYKLKVIIASTRPSRKGPLVADWFVKIAKDDPHFDVEVLDLKKIDLPLMDEPEHPRFQKYTKEHTKNWSKKIDEADAFIVVTPEYNYSFPATLKNAFDFLYKEWAEKPMGFVSYGGISAGTRSVQEIKGVVTTLNMMPLPLAVNIPMFSQFITDDGVFKGNEVSEEAAKNLLKELLRWTKALKTLREEIE